MKPDEKDKDIDEILRTYFPKAPENEVTAAQQRVWANLIAEAEEFLEQYKISRAMRKVEIEPLQPDDLPVLDAISLPNFEGQAERIARYVDRWFDRGIPKETVDASFVRLERQGLISARNRTPLVFAITPEGEAALARGRALAKELVKANAWK